MAMSVLFENTTKMDDEIINYLVRSSYRNDSKIRVYRIIMMVIGAIGIVGAVFYGYMTIKSPTLIGILYTAAMGIVGLYALYVSFIGAVRSEIRRFRNQYGDTLSADRYYKVYNSMIIQKLGSKTAEYKPYTFSSLEEHSHYFLLSYANNYIIIDKDGFTFGNADGFRSYIEGKIGTIR